MITTTEALADAVQAAQAAGAVGIDTEFVWDRCLLQQPLERQIGRAHV